MKRATVTAALVLVVAGVGCQRAPVDAPEWFSGTYEEALVAAQSRGTMLMLDFFSPT